MRRYGEAFRSDVTYRMRPGAYAILPRGGNLLLTIQAEPKLELQLPGGGIDPGEGPLTALHREVFEETGWRIAGARRIGAYRRFTFMPEYRKWAEKVCHIYVARPVIQLGEPAEEGHTAVWMTPDLAATEIESAGDRAFVRQLLG